SLVFFFQAEDGIRDFHVTGVQTCALPIFKANHPVEFMAAVMNCDIHLTDKLAVYKREADRMGIETVPPCVNRSAATFSVQDGKRSEERRVGKGCGGGGAGQEAAIKDTDES